MLESNKNRIPASKSTDYASWSLPDINDGQVIEVVPSGQHPGNVKKTLAAGGGKESKGSLAKLDEISKQAQKEGYQAGFEQGLGKGEAQGYQAGLSKGNKEIQQRLQQLQQVIAQLMEPIKQQDKELEQTLLALVKMAAEAVIKQELEDNRIDIIQRIIKETVTALPLGAENIRISLNSEDFAALQGESTGVSSDWQLVADDDITAGGCRVETAQSVVDYCLETRIQEVMEQIMGAAEDGV